MAESKDSSSFSNLPSENVFPVRISIMFFRGDSRNAAGKERKLGDSAVGTGGPEGRFLPQVRAEPMWRGRVKMEGPPALTEPGATSSATGPLGGGREVSTGPEGEEERGIWL